MSITPWILGLALAAAGCGKKGDAGKAKDVGNETRTTTPATPPVPAQWACAADGDCLISCAKGAVSRAWYEAADAEECKDGCAEGRGARCVDGACAAFTESGDPDPTCTRK